MSDINTPSADELLAVARLKVKMTPQVEVYTAKYSSTGIDLTTKPDRWTKELPLLPCLTDTTILRFYRGEKGDIDKAFKKMENFLFWRMETDADLVVSSMFTKETDANKMIFGDTTRGLSGRPAILYIANRHNKNDRDIDQVRKQIIHTLDHVIYKLSIGDERMVVMFDLKDLTLQCMDLEAIKMFIDVLQYNYSETLEKGLILDAPMIFSAFWAIIRPWLDPVTANKVQFIKRKELGEFFDRSTLPEVFR